MINLNQIPQALNIAYDLNINLALCGAHGRGKTAVIKQYAEENGFECIVKVLSQFAPEDMMGLPTDSSVGNEEATSYRAPDWLVKASDGKSKVLLFFDEFTNGEPDVQASILTLMSERESNGRKLNENCQIALAFNPPTIAPNAHTLSMATRDRLCVLPVSDSAVSYKGYYNKTGKTALTKLLDSEMVTINNYNDVVEEAAYENAELTYRSLEKCHDIAKYSIERKIDKDLAKELVCGYAGSKGGVVFKNLANVLEEETVSNGIIDDFTKEYESKGLKSAVKFLNGSDAFHTDFANLATFLNKVERIIGEENMDEFFKHSILTKEAVVRYNTIKNG